MNLNKKRIQLSILTISCILVAWGSFYFVSQKSRAAQAEPEGKTYTHLVTSKDREPLPVPQQTVKNGRSLVVPILMYHHVGELPKKADRTRQDLTVPTKDFEAEVKWLSEKGYTSISLRDIYLFSQDKFTMPKKPVIFTFDDGYLDVFQNAAPILKQYGFTGSFGIITGWPGQVQGDNIYASWADIETALLGGNEIVSHTQNHFDGSNPKFNTDFIFKNLSGSVGDIKQSLGFTTNILIYPYGHYTDAYIAQAKKAGFVMGITVHEGKVINLDDLMHIPRIRVHGQETLERFEKLITE